MHGLKIITEGASGLRFFKRGLRAALLVALVFAIGSVQAQVCQKLVATGNPEYTPYLWRDPTDETLLIGANADLMQLLAKDIGVPIDVKYLGPWSRVQELARTGRVDLVAGAFLTTARLDYMDYFQPAFRGTRTVIWTNPSKPFDYRSWKDLHNRNGLTVVNNSFGEAFDAYAKRHLTIATVGTLEQALEMMLRARADYLIYEEDPGLALAEKIGITSLQTAATAVVTESLYLTMSRKSPCNTAEMRERIAKSIRKLTGDNAMNALVSSNIQLWKQQATR